MCVRLVLYKFPGLFMALFVSLVDFRRHCTEGVRRDLVYIPHHCGVYLQQRCAKLPSSSTALCRATSFLCLHLE